MDTTFIVNDTIVIKNIISEESCILKQDNWACYLILLVIIIASTIIIYKFISFLEVVALKWNCRKREEKKKESDNKACKEQ